MKRIIFITLLLGHLTSLSQTLDSHEIYALVVGISDYQDTKIPDLRFADKDAEAFASFLRSPAGGALDEDHLKVLINEKATAAQFAIALDWLWEVAKENDKVIIYFSGHGDVERKSITQPGYLLCWDSPAKVYMAGGAFNIRDLNDVVSTISIQNKAKVILITDACRAGKLSGSGIRGAQATAANLAKQFANEIKILSCQPDEFSHEGEQWGGGRGAFSYHLLEGLYGMADGNDDLSVNLLEIGRYLEDNVSREVAPNSQIPITVGSRGERLTNVLPEILEQLKAGKKGQMQLFAATESRGIEDEVLASVDTITRKIYFAFKRALEEKQFLEPTNACADDYFEILMEKPKMERLHSTMRRNYAAALQDDAQQWMNTMLKSGLTDFVLKGVSIKELLKKYPSYLDRAANLLGEKHYMYPVLQARKYYFIGRLERKWSKKREAYHQALKLQPGMPLAYSTLIQVSSRTPDSSLFYFGKAIEQVPGWIEPYIELGLTYYSHIKDNDKAEEIFFLAEQVDSTSVRLWHAIGKFYFETHQYEKAKKWFLKTINGIGDDVCFPCAYNDLAATYVQGLNDYEKAEIYFKKAIELDSSFALSYYGLGNIYKNLDRFLDAEWHFQKSIELNPLYIPAHTNLSVMYSQHGHLEQAEKYLKQALEVDSSFSPALSNLAAVYRQTNQWEKIESTCQKALRGKQSYAYPQAHMELGRFYLRQKQFEKAEENFKAALALNPRIIIAYYNLACLYSRKEQSIKGFEYLEMSLKNGYNNYEWLQKDPDLKHLRGQVQQWNDLMQKYFLDKPKK